MDISYKIYFGLKASPSYQTVLDCASKFRKFIPAREGASTHVIETSNHEVMTKFDAFMKLMESIKDWDSTQVYQNGAKLLPSEFMLQEKKEIAACYHRYLAASDKDHFCDTRDPSCWGCRMLNDIILHHEKAVYSKEAKYWYQFGNFSDKNTWRINRENLSSALEGIVQEKGIDFCPVYEHVFFRRYMAALPLFIHMADTSNWDYVYIEDSVNSAVRWEPHSIKHIHPKMTTKEQEALARDSSSLSKIKDDSASDTQNRRYVPPHYLCRYWRSG
jgi:hypothetical protein